jgi:hypothetical protein
MKPLLITLSLALAAFGSTARAEYYRSSAVGGTAVLGAVAGALIGGHNGDRWAEGAIIGAAAGAVVGSVVDQSRPVAYRAPAVQPVAVVPCAPVVGSSAVYTTTPAQVVYVSAPPPPAVVYVSPRPVVVSRPVVYVSVGNRHGPVYRHGRAGYRRW